MTKTEIKEKAQQELMSAMQTAFYRIRDAFDQDISDMTTEQKQDLQLAMSRQFARIENLFGYEKYSWTRG